MSKIKLLPCIKCKKKPTNHSDYGDYFDKCYVDCVCGNTTDVFYNSTSPKEQWNYLNKPQKKSILIIPDEFKDYANEFMSGPGDIESKYCECIILNMYDRFFKPFTFNNKGKEK